MKWALDESAQHEADAAFCAACSNRGLTAFYQVSHIPTQSCVLLDTAEEAASYPVGNLLLGLCESCGFIQNVRFDPAIVDYSKPTEESQAFSGRFQAFATELARRIVDDYQLEGCSVLEVGCGKGDFMRLLVDEGIGSGVGIDPGFLPDRLAGESGPVEFIRGWYDASSTQLSGDLVLTRHLMEHVPNVGEFLSWLVESTRRTPGAVLFTEVPDTGRVLREGAFWDIYYEHCSYFTLGSLGRAVRRSGVSVDVLETAFDDQYLLTAGRPVVDPEPNAAEEPVSDVVSLVQEFASRAESARNSWRERIESVFDGGGTVCIWGGGSKTVAFLTTLGLGSEANRLRVVDINIHKQERWLPGTRVRVDSPTVLAGDPPALVIAMNGAYVGEIESDLDSMRLTVPVEPV